MNKDYPESREHPDENESGQIDVKQLMSEIRQRVEEKYRSGFYPPESRSFRLSPGSAAASGDSISRLRAIQTIRIEGEPITSHRRVTGGAIKSVKKFVRFWTRRYTDPLFLQQNYFNSEAVAAIEELKREVESLRQEVQQLRSDNEARQR